MPVLSVKIHSNIIPEFTNFQCFKCFLLVQSLSHVQLFLMPYQDPCSMPGFPVHHQLERKMFSLKGHRASLIAQLVKNPPAMQETWVGPWVGKIPGEGKGYPFQYTGLENSVDCIFHGVSKSQTWLSDFHFTSLKGPYSKYFRFYGSYTMHHNYCNAKPIIDKL